MPHDRHVVDGVNKDAVLWPGCTLEEARDYYVELAEGWEPYNPDPVVVSHAGVRVVRDDLIVGTKARAADLLVARSNYSNFVYCQPRHGLAGASLLAVAKRYGKTVTLFMPACERISEHQAVCIERGATPVFERIAAMPILNMYAKKWAEENDSFFVPLGLKHELATAGIIRAAMTIQQPEVCWTATSTGVLTRALQIAWPYTEFVSVCVARNMKAGELGRARAVSHPLPFEKEEKPENLPPFPSVPNYDAKVFHMIPKNTKNDHLFWNVGASPVLLDETVYDRIDSRRDWRKNIK